MSIKREHIPEGLVPFVQTNEKLNRGRTVWIKAKIRSIRYNDAEATVSHPSLYGFDSDELVCDLDDLFIETG